MNTETAFKKGYLEEKTIILKPVPRGGKMVGLDKPTHINFFMANGARESFVIPLNKRGDRIDIFSSSEEREFFEKEIQRTLNVNDDNGYLATFKVTVEKDEYLMDMGLEFDLSKPMDNIRYRVLKIQPTIAPSWEERYDDLYKWALVDKRKELAKEDEEFNALQKALIGVGSVESSESKLRKFLKIYYIETKSSKKIGNDYNLQTLRDDVRKIAKENPERFLSVFENPLLETQMFTIDALEASAINKDGNNEYSFAGEDKTYQFRELVIRVDEEIKSQSDLFFKIKQQIQQL